MWCSVGLMALDGRPPDRESADWVNVSTEQVRLDCLNPTNYWEGPLSININHFIGQDALQTTV